MAEVTKISFDTYTLRARYEPGLVVALPLGLAAIAWFPGGIPGWSVFSAVLITFGGAALLGQLASKRKKFLPVEMD
jgi:hypothetical protein